MSKEIVYTENAPAPIGPYSQAILTNGTLYISGQIAIDQPTGKLITDSIEAETEQVMKNLSYILKSAGMDFSNIVKCSIFLSDMNDFNTVNDIYGRSFPENPPARETVAVRQLPKNVNVEISCIAVK